MHFKVVLLLLMAIAGGFFYLHVLNPARVDFTIGGGLSYLLPVTVLAAAGFVAGAVFMLVNSMVGDLRRAVKDIRQRRESKKRETTEAHYRAGVSALTRGETAKARDYINRAIEMEPSGPDLYLHLAETYGVEGRHAEALDAIERGLARNTDCPELLLAAARSADAAGDARRLDRALAAVIDADPENRYALARLRDIKVEAGDYPKAIDLQRKVVSSAKEARRAGYGSAADEERLLLGLLYEDAAAALAAGRHDDVFHRAKEILKKDQSFAPAYMVQGDAYRSQGNVKAAVQAWERGYDETSDPVFFLKIEDVYIERSDPQTLIEKYRDAVFRNPGDVEMKLLYARLYLRLMMIDEAIESLERIKSDVEESYYLDLLLGEAYLRRNQMDKAVRFFRKALFVDKNLSPAYRCSHCKRASDSWLASCPSCKRWNELKMDRSAAAPARPSQPAGAAGAVRLVR